MPLWGKAAAGTQAQKPKWLSTDENSDYKKQDCIGMPGGWAMRAGTAASGNGNTGAQQEVIAAQSEFNIRSTPSFLINGDLLEGDKSIKVFRQILDKILSD